LFVKLSALGYIANVQIQMIELHHIQTLSLRGTSLPSQVAVMGKQQALTIHQKFVLEQTLIRG